MVVQIFYHFRFFPPMHPGMRPPGPFPPGFMGPGRPPFGMRGMRPMRLPMPPPHFMRMPGAYHRYGGPTATRGPHFESRPTTTSVEESSTKNEGPKPLMSIATPGPVKAMVQAQQNQMQRGRGGIMGLGMGPRYHTRGSGVSSTVQSRGGPPSGQRMPLKRPATSYGSQPMNVDEPRNKMPNTSRTNLKFIRTVDEPMQQTPSSSSYYNQQQSRQVYIRFC